MVAPSENPRETWGLYRKMGFWNIFVSSPGQGVTTRRGVGTLFPGLLASGALLTLVVGGASPSPQPHAGAPPTPTAQQPLGLAGNVEFTSAHEAAASTALEDSGAPWAVLGPQHRCADHTWLVQDSAFGAAHSCWHRKGHSASCIVWL